jgi:acyl carrier protein
MSAEEIEKKVREFLTDEMLKEQAAVAASSDPLDFDSLEQTEIRVYLEEAFGTDVKNLKEPFGSIGQIVDFVRGNAA